MNDKELTKQQIKAIDSKAGAAVDAADGCSVDEKEVKAYIRELNDNPRDNAEIDD